MEEIRRRGFGTYKNSFKLFNQAGDELSLSVNGSEVAFFSGGGNKKDDRLDAYPSDATEFVALLAAHLGYKLVKEE